MKLFINAGGKGERLYPLTKDIPKPLVPLCGKPIIEHLVDWSKKYGIDEIVMMNGHMADKIIEYFGDGSKFGIKIIHSTEPRPLGSGGPLKYAKDHINNTIVHLSGDVFCEVDLNKMLEFHRKNNSKITVLVHKSSHPNDSDVLNINEDGKILRFISKHDDHTGAGDLTNAGLAIIEPEIIDLMEEEVFNFENYLYPIILKNNIPFYGYNSEEFMLDIGNVERLKKCEDYLNHKLNKQNGESI
jgi:mannose-1-phosphate guanylyltransferase / phosphomannomutase